MSHRVRSRILHGVDVHDMLPIHEGDVASAYATIESRALFSDCEHVSESLIRVDCWGGCCLSHGLFKGYRVLACEAFGISVGVC